MLVKKIDKQQENIKEEEMKDRQSKINVLSVNKSKTEK